MCLLRDESVESGRETYEACLKYRDMIHGIGLDSYELGRSAMLFDDIYKRAKADGFHLTAHCDVNMPETHEHILECATKLSGDGITRIDHGLNAAEIPKLIQIIKERGIGLTCCPWGAYGYLVHIEGEKSLFTDMIRKLFDEGVLLTISSDDPAYMGMNWVQESLILVAEKCKFTMQEMVVLEKNAVKISWAPEKLKNMIMEELEGVLAAQA
jgi:adenosine deaminase